MKKLLWLLPAVIIIGCAVPNPSYNSSQPPSGSNPPYAPNPAGTNAAGIAGAVAPFVPPPWGEVVGGIGALAAVIAGAIAKSKNNQAIAAQAATTQLATSVAAQGPAVAQAVIDHASGSAQAAPVFAAVNSALPPDPVTPKPS